MISRVVTNAGVGLVQATFDNLSTSVAATKARAITQADLTAGRDAVSIFGNNQVGVSTSTATLLGKALSVSDELDTKGNPKYVTVQTSGIADMHGTTTAPTAGSRVSQLGGKCALNASGTKGLCLTTYATKQHEVDLAG